jgi:predicted nuclease of predicted toxin-antitoxin system
VRVKLDENVSVRAKALFVAAGHDAESVIDEGMPGVRDEELLAVCAREERVLVTFDVGFGDVRAHPPGTHAGVVLLRLRDQQPAATFEVLRSLLAAHDLVAFAGSLAVVTDENVRIRRA